MNNKPDKGRGGRRHQLLYNNDRGFFYYLEPSTGVAGITNELIGRLRGTRIDTLITRIDRGNLVPMYDSRIEGKVGKGEATFPNVEVWRHTECLRRLFDRNIDPWEEVFKECRREGMEAFAGIRMNDLHHTKMKKAFTVWDSFYLSNITRNSKYYIGQDYAHFAPLGTVIGKADLSKVLNFIHDEVRAHRVAIVTELIERYDLDGIELDFQRHGLYFGKSQVPDGLKLMTCMLQEIRGVLNQFERERGHPICLAVRVPSSIDLCIASGLDVPTWVGEEIIDILELSAIGITEFDIPIDPFVKLAESTSCEIIPAFEYMTQPPYVRYLPQMARASAAWYYHQNVDGIAFHNDHFFYEPFSDFSDGTLKVYEPITHRVLYSECHDPMTIRHRSKRYAISAELKQWPSYPKPLPTTWTRTDVGHTKHFNINIADDMKSAAESALLETTELRLLFKGICEQDILDVSFNGHALNAQQRETSSIGIGNQHSHGDNYLHRWTLDPGWIATGNNAIDITLALAETTISAPIELFGVEVDINYRNLPSK